jgi:Mitochondrial carrier protein
MSLCRHATRRAQGLPIGVKTAAGSVVASGARLALLPLDVVKTVLQVEGARGWPLVRRKLAAHGPAALFHGSVATMSSSLISHYPWFFVVRPAAAAFRLVLEAGERAAHLAAEQRA